MIGNNRIEGCHTNRTKKHRKNNKFCGSVGGQMLEPLSHSHISWGFLVGAAVHGGPRMGAVEDVLKTHLTGCTTERCGWGMEVFGIHTVDDAILQTLKNGPKRKSLP